MEYECSKCHEIKPNKDFFTRENGYRRLQCKTCLYKANRKNYDHEKERYRKLQNTFGIGKEDFEDLMTQQNGVCAICGNPPKKYARNRGVLCVDHNHETGKVRALLCRPCNQGLGLFYDNKELLRKAKDYLEKHE
jgi:hypothetical protein